MPALPNAYPRCIESARWIALVATLFATGSVQAGSFQVNWAPVDHPDRAGYRVFYGSGPNDLSQSFDVGNVSSATIEGLQPCTTYHVAVKSLDTSGGESEEYSNPLVGWARPQVTSASHSSVEQGSLIVMTVSGANFHPDASVGFANPGIVVQASSVDGCGALAVTALVQPDAALGPSPIYVINPDRSFGAATLLAVTASQDTVGPMIEQIAVQDIGPTGVSVAWSTNEASDSQVFYRRLGDSAFQPTSLQTAPVVEHEVRVGGLRPETTYEFYVASADPAGNETTGSSGSTFTTSESEFDYLRIEGESIVLSPPLEVTYNDEAFGGAWINLQAGSAPGWPADPNGTWDVGFDLSTGGTWFFWYRLYAPDDNSDGWLERVDGVDFNWLYPPVLEAWTWQAGRSYALSAGQHVLTLGGREALARLDRIIITDDPDFVPNESPGFDVEPPGMPLDLDAQALPGAVNLFWTNPTASDLDRIVVRYRTDGVFPLNPYDGALLFEDLALPGDEGGAVHGGLSGDFRIYYSVFAIDAVGNVSPRSSMILSPAGIVTTPGVVPNLRRNDTTGN